MTVLHDDEKPPLVFFSYTRESPLGGRRSLMELEHELASLSKLHHEIAHATEPLVLLVGPWDSTARTRVDQERWFTHESLLPSPIDLGGAAATFMVGTAGRVPATGFRSDERVLIRPPNGTQASAFALYSLRDQLPLDDRPTATFWPPGGAPPPVVVAPGAVPQGSLPGLDLVVEEDQTPSGTTPLPVASPIAGPRRLAFAITLDKLSHLRAYLVQLIDSRRTVLRLEIRRRLAVLISPPDTPTFLLRLLAVSRRYGRRDEPDDDALLAHRWFSVIGGEPAVSC